MTKVSVKQQRQELINEIVETHNELDYLEHKLLTSLGKLRKLKPTKKEIADNDLEDLLEYYL